LYKEGEKGQTHTHKATTSAKKTNVTKKHWLLRSTLTLQKANKKVREILVESKKHL